MSPHPRRSRTRSIGDHVDFNDAPACQVGHADGRSCGQTIARKIRHIEAIDRSIVALELGEENPHADHMLKPRARAGERAQKIVKTFRVCASIPSGSGRLSSSGSVASCPVTKSQPSASTTWL